MTAHRRAGRPGIILGLLLFSLAAGGCAKRIGTADLTAGEGQRPPGSATDAANRPGDGAGAAGAREGQAGLDDVFFTYDDATLGTEARAVLARNGEALKERAGLPVTIEGHCDERGSVEYNLALGQLRADAARSYLLQLGVPADRVGTISFGETRPFVTGAGEGAWAQNRRAHFVVGSRP